MIGYAYLHTALDDHSRLAYTEILPDDRKDTDASLWHRANTWFTIHSITVRRVVTDNGAPATAHAPDATPSRSLIESRSIRALSAATYLIDLRPLPGQAWSR